MKLPHPFIQLPLTFDAARLAAEVAAVDERHWRDHPQKFPGNSMLPLTAVGGDPANESFSGVMRPTPYLAQCQYLCQLLAALGVTIGRTRLMRLEGHAEVTPHSDQGYYWVDRVRIHVPIVTQPSVQFHCEDAVLNMKAGECWIFDTWRKHNVINDNGDRRIHLVVDTVGGAKFWNMVEAGRPYPQLAGQQPWAPTPVPFDPEGRPALALETVNVPDVMTPWELEAHLAFLLNDSEPHPQTPMVRRCIAILSRDWRALWALYGARVEGHRPFKIRLEQFLNTVRAPASAITLKNGANLYTVIVTMIGKPAVGVNFNKMDAAALADRA